MPLKHWDFVLTCFEPIVRVTGGIGTYTRLLLERLDKLQVDGRPASVLFLTAERNRSQEASALAFDHVRTEYIAEEVKFGDVPLNNLRDPYLHFSYGVMQRLIDLQRAGHTFGVVEVPDYSAEGYYLCKARQFGMLQVQNVAVRLHSPLRMLVEDNNERAWQHALAQHLQGAELYVYRAADVILYGGDAMRDRIVQLVPESERASFLARARKIPHPFPNLQHVWNRPPARVNGSARHVKVGYLGRVEYRKGVDLLVRAALTMFAGKDTPDVSFHFFGRDTANANLGSMVGYIQTLIPDALKERFHFHAHIPQQELWAKYLPDIDLFVFPSRFENYPNVLLEVAGLGRPTLVSKHGCMPEMGARFPWVQSIDPFNRNELAAALKAAIDAHATPVSAEARDAVKTEIASITERIIRGYEELIALPPAPRRSIEGEKQPSIAFVVPHFNHADWIPALLDTITPALKEGDEIVVVDDCSEPAQRDRAREITEQAGHRFLSTGVNSGPSAARNLGAANTTADLLYFVDSDDELVTATIPQLREAFVRDPKLDVVSGFMRAFGDQNHFWASYDPLVSTILTENSSHAGIVIRRELFDRVGGYEGKLRMHFEDWEFHARLVLAGARFEILPLVTYRYRVNLTQGRNSSNLGLLQLSYQQVLRSALGSVPPARLAELWPDVSQLLAGAIIQHQHAASRPPVVETPTNLRYRLADALNSGLKLTPLHPPMKYVLLKAEQLLARDGASDRKS